ncbi:MAG: autotransporter outer membrane beta-barrel domain-containing protein [Planctomycetaceae bacterium]|nr:autotransporter outer membrane beta-barrel domain-containing protein [Planctomycetaceae bacterium]
MDGSNAAALTTITTLTGGSSHNAATTLHIGDTARAKIVNDISGYVAITSSNRLDETVRVDSLGNGAILAVGTSNGTGSATGEDAAAGIFINSIASAATVDIASVDGDAGRVVVDGGNIAGDATINLRNAVFQVAEGTGNSQLALAAMNMDSSAGDSHLIADTSAGFQILDFQGNTPTVTVGSGGDVIIESHSLVYGGVLKTAVNPGTAGQIHFDESSPNANRMVFWSSDSTNNFDQGVEIDGGQFEFEGATTFVAVSTTPSTENFIRDSEIRFTGLDETGASLSRYIIDGTAANNTIDATGTTLHFNKGVNITYLNQGALTNLERVVIGDEYKGYATFGDGANDTVMTAKHLTVDTHGGEISNLSIGGDASPSFTNGLRITSSAELAGKTLVDGTLSLYENDGDATVTITGADGGFVLTVNSRDSSVEDGTRVQISEDAYSGTGLNSIAFLSADAGAGNALDSLIAEMASHVTVDTSNLTGNVHGVIDSSGVIYYQKFSSDDPMGHVPLFARPMIVAVDQLDPLFGLYLRGAGDPVTGTLSTGLYHRELTQIMGNTLSSSMSMVQNGATTAFDRLNATVPRPNGTVSAESAEALPSVSFRSFSCTDERRTNGLWVTPGYTNQSVDGNYGSGYGDFDVKGFTVAMGYDRWLNDVFRIGGLFRYGRPELDGDYQNIDADDIQAGLYGQGLVPFGVIVNAGLALGWQDYESKRSIRLTGLPEYNQDLRADYHGKSLSLALEVSRPVVLQNNVFLRPALGYTYQRVHLDEIGETSTLPSGATNLAQRIAGSRFTTQQVRLGTDVGWTNDPDTVSLSGRAFWVANVGDKQPSGAARFINAGFGALPFRVVGARYSDHMANLGVSLLVRPAAVSGVTFGVDYDFLWGAKSTDHNVGVKFGYEF